MSTPAPPFPIEPPADQVCNNCGQRYADHLAVLNAPAHAEANPEASQPEPIMICRFAAYRYSFVATPHEVA
jgi:hypothetical protein